MHHLTCSFENNTCVVRRVRCNDGTVRALAKDIGKLLNESNVSKQLGKYNLSNLTTSVNPDILDSFTNNERNSLIISLSSVNDYINHRHKKEKYNCVKEYLNEHWNDGLEENSNSNKKQKINETTTTNEECPFILDMENSVFLIHNIAVPFGYDNEGDIVFRGLNIARALGYARPDNAILQHTKSEMRVTTVYDKPLYGLVERKLIHGQGYDGIWITEPGLYNVIFHSRMPKAAMMQNWVLKFVLPLMRILESTEEIDYPPLAADAYNGQVLYLFWLKKLNALKFGSSRDLHKRSVCHQRSFGQVVLVHVIETYFAAEIESSLKIAFTERQWKRNDIIVNRHKQTEILDLNKTSIEEVIDLMEVFTAQHKKKHAQDSCESLEYEKEKTKQLEAKARIAEAEARTEACKAKQGANYSVKIKN